jgi:hypothetical protein
MASRSAANGLQIGGKRIPDRRTPKTLANLIEIQL